MTTVRELFTRLGFKTDTASLNKAEQGINRVKDGAERAAAALRNAALALGGFAAVQGLVRVADEMQSLRTRIGLLSQTTDEAGVAFDAVADRAIATRQDLSTYAGFYIKAGKATESFIKTQGDLMNVVDGAALGLAASGSSAQGQKEAFFQLGQAIGSPVVQMEEMNTLIDVAPDLFRALGQAIPGAQGNLKQFIGTGAVTGEMLAKGLIKVRKQFEEQMLKMPMTVGTAQTIISSRWSRMIDKMNRESGVITKIANRMLDAFDKIEAGIGFLIDKLGGFENAVRLAGFAIVAAFGAKTLQVLAAFRLASLAALWPYIRMIAVLTAVTLLLEDLYVWIQGGDSVTGQFLGTWENLKATFMAVWPIIKNIGGAVMLLGTALGVAKVASILINGAMIALNITMGIFNMLLNMSPLGKIIMLVGLLAAAGIALYKNWDTVKAWFASFFGWMGSKFEWLLDKIRGLGAIAGLIPGLNVVAGGLAAYDAMKASPSKMASSGLGGGGVTSNTTVNMTVPPGTTKEQQAAVKRTAEMAFGKPNTSLARDISARGR